MTGGPCLSTGPPMQLVSFLMCVKEKRYRNDRGVKTLASRGVKEVPRRRSLLSCASSSPLPPSPSPPPWLLGSTLADNPVASWLYKWVEHGMAPPLSPSSWVNGTPGTRCEEAAAGGARPGCRRRQTRSPKNSPTPLRRCLSFDHGLQRPENQGQLVSTGSYVLICSGNY